MEQCSFNGCQAQYEGHGISHRPGTHPSYILFVVKDEVWGQVRNNNQTISKSKADSYMVHKFMVRN